MGTLRTIQSLCKNEGVCFQTELVGGKYCSLAYTKPIECEHLGEKGEDGLYYCKLEREEEFGKN